MIESPIGFGVYLALKYAAYTCWMYVGLRTLTARPAIARALGLGFLRLVMGMALGFGIFLASTATAAAARDKGLPPQISAYLAVYVPVRWLEWAVMGVLLRPVQSVAQFIADTDWAGRRWRLGGIAISCLADLVVIADLGSLPIGRFFC